MKTELILKFTFEASHSLAGFETPHPHLWKLEVAIQGQPVKGRIIDMVTLRERLQALIDQLKGTYLNESTRVDEQVKKFPTCETLSLFFSKELQEILKVEFFNQNPTVHLSSVQVAICDMDGTEMGAVRLGLNEC